MFKIIGEAIKLASQELRMYSFPWPWWGATSPKELAREFTGYAPVKAKVKTQTKTQTNKPRVTRAKYR